ncbi:MAG: ABC transporter ATP-binding protein [Desulfococcaceae bacterium]|jgi:putative ABC transport system ATP-binding protein|nr:ABC transporter ATP-binding protein [Desulfococcaceae bacterium]
MPVIESRKLKKSYRLQAREILILDEIDLAVESGEFLVISGNSGSGKTTLLSLLSGLDRPDSGSVFIQDKEISLLSEEEMAPLRNRIFGFVFQSFHLIPSLTALENVMLPAELCKDSAAREKAVRLLERVGLGQRHANFPPQLSGGEKQRVAICRALINDPKIIFADEPTGNLDSEHSRAVLDILCNLQEEQHASLILVTHSAEIAARADRVIRLKDGKIQSV